MGLNAIAKGTDEPATRLPDPDTTTRHPHDAEDVGDFATRWRGNSSSERPVYRGRCSISRGHLCRFHVPAVSGTCEGSAGGATLSGTSPFAGITARTSLRHRGLDLAVTDGGENNQKLCIPLKRI